MSSRHMKYGVSAGSVLALSVAAAVPVSASESGLKLEEVVVTARKREESLLDAPLSITAFTGEALVNMGVENFEDWGSHVPGLSFTQRDPAGSRGAGPTLSVRGVNGAAVGGDSAIGFYINDTPVGSLNLKYYDIERVEVLKGPQGTLYGGMAMGGLVKVVTNKANSTETEFGITGDISNTKEGGNNYDLNTMLNVPLVDGVLGLRAVGYVIEKEGYIDWLPLGYREPLPQPGLNADDIQDDVDKEKTYGGRMSLNYDATESLAFTLEAMYEEVKTDHRSEWDVPLEPFFGELVSGASSLLPSESELFIPSLSIDWDITSGINLISSTSFARYETSNLEEGAYFANSTLASVGEALGAEIDYFEPKPLQTGREREILTQEFRLSSQGDGRLQWLLGAFYQERDIVNTFFWEPEGVADAVNSAIGFPLFPNDLMIDQVSETAIEELGLFGELYYDLTEKLSITMGLRYFDNQFDFMDDRDGFFGSPLVETEAGDNGVNPKLAASYQVTDDALVYASASRGFRRAGASPVGLIPPNCAADLAELGFADGAPGTFDSDKLNAYEIGFKGSFADGRASIESAAYYYDWKDKQELVFLPQCGFSFSANVGESEIYGVEMSANVMLAEGLTAAVNAAHLDAEVAEDTPEAGLVEGDPLPITPEWTLGASLSYERPIFADLDGFLRLDYQYRDEIIEPVRRNTLDSYYTWNLRVGISRAQKYEVSLYANNLTDERGELYDSSGIMTGQVNAFRLRTTRPRTIGLRATWRY